MLELPQAQHSLNHAARIETSANAGRDQVSLRAKLLLGYTVYIAACVLLGGWSAWHIRAMGKVS